MITCHASTCRLFLCFAHVSFAWIPQSPEVYPEEWHTAQEEASNLTLQIISTEPRLYYVDNFVSHDEADYIKKVAEPLLVEDEYTGASVELPVDDDPVLRRISLRKYALLNFSNYMHGTFRVRRYREGEGHPPHTDWWESWFDYEKPANLILTYNIYLNTVEEGGETGFPNADLNSTSRKGRMAIWWTCNTMSKIDDMSEHLGHKVVKGEKWLATTFVYNHLEVCDGVENFGEEEL